MPHEFSRFFRGGGGGRNWSSINFKRSIDQYKLKYTTFVGDGDSDTFNVFQEGMHELYGDRYNVVKEECIEHIKCDEFALQSHNYIH